MPSTGPKRRAARKTPPALPNGMTTVTLLAAELGVGARAVQQRAAQLDPPPLLVGRTQLLTPEQADAIRAGLADPTKRGPKPRGGT